MFALQVSYCTTPSCQRSSGWTLWPSTFGAPCGKLRANYSSRETHVHRTGKISRQKTHVSNMRFRFRNFRVKEQSLFYAYCVWGWGVPTCFLITALTMHHAEGHNLKPGFGEYGCWFSGKFLSENAFPREISLSSDAASSKRAFVVNSEVPRCYRDRDSSGAIWRII